MWGSAFFIGGAPPTPPLKTFFEIRVLRIPKTSIIKSLIKQSGLRIPVWNRSAWLTVTILRAFV